MVRDHAETVKGGSNLASHGKTTKHWLWYDQFKPQENTPVYSYTAQETSESKIGGDQLYTAGYTAVEGQRKGGPISRIKRHKNSPIIFNTHFQETRSINRLQCICTQTRHITASLERACTVPTNGTIRVQWTQIWKITVCNFSHKILNMRTKLNCEQDLDTSLLVLLTKFSRARTQQQSCIEDLGSN